MIFAFRSALIFCAAAGFAMACEVGCKSHRSDQREGSASTDASADSTEAKNAKEAIADAPEQATPQVTPPVAPQITSEGLEGALYTKEVQAAFRVAGCGGDDAFIPPNIDKEIVDAHCAALEADYAEFKKDWLDVAMPFIEKIRPPSTPSVVVYPFGGGDLVGALATYPNANEITTISLEIAGDVRGILKVDSTRLSRELAKLRDHLGKLFLKAHSRTLNLDIESHGAIPGEIAFPMAALALHGAVPVTLRYFTIDDDGAFHWLTDDEIEQAVKAGKSGRAGPFANAEIRFKEPNDANVRVLRHIAFDLSNKNVTKKPFFLNYLNKHTEVSAMTKAASHLLWDDENFSILRDWLMTHTSWMISDTTGVPPRIAKKYGFVQDVYGQFEWPEPFGTVNNHDAADFRDLFKGSDPLPFRYGYPDNNGHGHIVITRKP
ncbi:MAG: hypothetical protein FWD73_02400 [Polyangiaceae bacterium]|nr:hypothetical protein [Polyangiaceae bacterium]